MSNPTDSDDMPITSVRQMADYFAAGCKPREQWRIGTEHEKFGFRLADFAPPPYEPGGIRAVLDGLAGPDWTPIVEKGLPIGLKGGGPHRGASISLEPGGQFELSGAPLRTLHQTRSEMDDHFAAVAAVAEDMGIGFAPLGFHPTITRAQAAWMPKGRYAIMRRYMQLTGSKGLDMMLRTCTVQVNLDFSSEDDMRRKLRVALALQPLATALFANSPFTEGRPNGLLSARADVWTDVDPDRTGMPDFMFAEDFGFERYVEYLLDMPMYFIFRNGVHVDVAGQSFRAFVAGQLPAAAGQRATMGDFADHTTTAFTDVRLKQFLEMRGADAGSPAMMLAQSALWTGLLYDDAALAAAEALVREHPVEDYRALRAVVPRLAMNAPWAGGTLRGLAGRVLAIAAGGLRARANRVNGRDESEYLEPLHEIASGGPTQAEIWLVKQETVWQGKVARIFDEARV